MSFLLFAWLSWGSGPGLSSAEPDVPEAVVERVDALSRGDAVDRERWLAQTRAKAVEHYAGAHRAVARSSSRQLTCRRARLDQARTLIARIDELGAVVTPAHSSLPVRRAGLLAIALAEHPVSMVEPDSPCESPTGASGRRWRGPVSERPAAAFADDPLTLGFDQPGRRALKLR